MDLRAFPRLAVVGCLRRFPGEQPHSAPCWLSASANSRSGGSRGSGLFSPGIKIGGCLEQNLWCKSIYWTKIREGKICPGKKRGTPDPNATIRNLSPQVPHYTKYRDALLPKKYLIPPKANVPAQLFLVMLAVCSTEGLLITPKTPLTSKSRWCVRVDYSRDSVETSC